MKFEPFDWYNDALYYDIVFDVETADDADFLEAAAQRFGRTGSSRVLEPACGSGRLMAEMVSRGWRATGFDAAQGMLRFARRRLRDAGHSATLTCDRMESFSVRGKFDLAHCFVSTFKYLMTEAHARAHLVRVASALAPGGVYVLGMHMTDYADRARQRERWVTSRNGVDVVCNIQSWPADRRRRVEHVRSRLTVTEGDCVRRLESAWDFRTYGLGQLRSLLRSVPALEHVATFGFTPSIDEPIPFDGQRLDVVLVLRRVD